MQLEDYFLFEKFEECDRIRIKGSRIAIDFIIGAYQKGTSPEKIVERFPSVNLEQVFATLTYYLHNKAEVEEYLKKREDLANAYYQEHLNEERPEVVKRLVTLRDQQEKLSGSHGK